MQENSKNPNTRDNVAKLEKRDEKKTQNFDDDE